MYLAKLSMSVGVRHAKLLIASLKDAIFMYSVDSGLFAMRSARVEVFN